jgi:hypothetical protein
MAREMIERITCDCCGKPIKAMEQALRVSSAIDTRMDAAGSSETVYDAVDLCGRCGAYELARLVNAKPERQSRAGWFQEVRNRLKAEKELRR